MTEGLLRREAEDMEERARIPKAMGGHRERPPSARGGERPRKRPALPAPWPRTSSLQSCEELNYCCFRQPGCGVFSGGPSKPMRILSQMVTPNVKAPSPTKSAPPRPHCTRTTSSHLSDESVHHRDGTARARGEPWGHKEQELHGDRGTGRRFQKPGATCRFDPGSPCGRL